MTDPKLTEAKYIAGLLAASTSAELDDAIRVPFPHRFSGAQWNRICDARLRAGLSLCDRHPAGHMVPRLGNRRLLSVAGETYRVARGGNSTGVRYAWHYAEEWAIGVLRRHGLGKRASIRVFDLAFSYPHRSLKIIDDALAGQIDDPPLDVLIWSERPHGRPIRYSIDANCADDGDHRATRSCRCGGTLGAAHL